MEDHSKENDTWPPNEYLLALEDTEVRLRISGQSVRRLNV